MGLWQRNRLGGCCWPLLRCLRRLRRLRRLCLLLHRLHLRQGLGMGLLWRLQVLTLRCLHDWYGVGRLCLRRHLRHMLHLWCCLRGWLWCG